MHNKTDEQVAKLVQSGDVDVFAILVERFDKKMHRYARRFLFNKEDAEDLVQAVFIKSFTNIKSFDTERKFSSWIYRIAHNEFINALKKRKREPLSLFDFDTLLPHPIAKEKTDKDIKEVEMKELVEKCLEDLGIKYREPLVLYYLEELSYKEISEILRIPVATVGVRLRRAKKLVQETCDKKDLYE
jgi:RNA polymerase sigma-70 factor, ECF subfamily